jgi:hypothetical protein
VDTRLEITRTVSLLRSLLRSELGDCERSIAAGDVDRTRQGISEVHDKPVRAINVLNRLR